MDDDDSDDDGDEGDNTSLAVHDDASERSLSPSSWDPSAATSDEGHQEEASPPSAVAPPSGHQQRDKSSSQASLATHGNAASSSGSLSLQSELSVSNDSARGVSAGPPRITREVYAWLDQDCEEAAAAGSSYDRRSRR